MDHAERGRDSAVRADLVREIFIHDCDEDTVAAALGRLTRQSGGAFAQAPRAMRGGASSPPASCAAKIEQALPSSNESARGPAPR